jgi:hypothetical protein
MEDCQKWSVSRRVGCNVVSNLRLVRSLISSHPQKSLGETFIQNYARRVFYANADKVHVTFDVLDHLELSFDCSEGDCSPDILFKDELLQFLVGTIKASGNSVFHRTLENSIARSTQQAVNENIGKNLRPFFQTIPICAESEFIHTKGKNRH